MRKGGTILYIGDSIGWKSNTTLIKGTDLFPWKVRDAIRTNYGACRLINKGIGGSFTDNLVNNHQWLLQLDPPDLILISIGTNDCVQGAKPISTFQTDFGITLNRLKIKFPNAHIIYCLPPRTLDPNRSPYIQQFRDAGIATAQSYGCDICHFESAWSTDAGNIEADNIHPNATGHTALFNVLWPVVQQGQWLNRLSKNN